MHVTGLMCQQKVPQQQGKGGRVYTCNCICGPQAACPWSSNSSSVNSWNKLPQGTDILCTGHLCLWWGQHGSCTVSQTLSSTMQRDKVITADPPCIKHFLSTTAGMQRFLSACHLYESRGAATAATHCHSLSPITHAMQKIPMTLALAR